MTDLRVPVLRGDVEAAQRKIFVGGLNYSTDDDKLRKYFSTYGSVQDAVVMKDPMTKKSRGFGFITFTDADTVDAVLESEPHTIDSRKVEAKRAVPRTDSPSPTNTTKSSNSSTQSARQPMTTETTADGRSSPPVAPTLHSGSKTLPENAPEHKVAPDYTYNKIFVGGLHYDTRDADFKAYFEKFGRVVQSEVMFNRETHKSRGFGFVVFESETGADRTCAEAEHVINGKIVEVKRAVPRAKLGPNELPPKAGHSGSHNKHHGPSSSGPSSGKGGKESKRHHRQGQDGRAPSQAAESDRAKASQEKETVNQGAATFSYAAALKAGNGANETVDQHEEGHEANPEINDENALANVPAPVASGSASTNNNLPLSFSSVLAGKSKPPLNNSERSTPQLSTPQLGSMAASSQNRILTPKQIVPDNQDADTLVLPMGAYPDHAASEIPTSSMYAANVATSSRPSSTTNSRSNSIVMAPEAPNVMPTVPANETGRAETGEALTEYPVPNTEPSQLRQVSQSPSVPEQYQQQQYQYYPMMQVNYAQQHATPDNLSSQQRQGTPAAYPNQQMQAYVMPGQYVYQPQQQQQFGNDYAAQMSAMQPAAYDPSQYAYQQAYYPHYTQADANAYLAYQLQAQQAMMHLTPQMQQMQAAGGTYSYPVQGAYYAYPYDVQHQYQQYGMAYDPQSMQMAPMMPVQQNGVPDMGTANRSAQPSPAPAMAGHGSNQQPNEMPTDRPTMPTTEEELFNLKDLHLGNQEYSQSQYAWTTHRR